MRRTYSGEVGLGEGKPDAGKMGLGKILTAEGEISRKAAMAANRITAAGP
jgi:hypothetical protein